MGLTLDKAHKSTCGRLLTRGPELARSTCPRMSQCVLRRIIAISSSYSGFCLVTTLSALASVSDDDGIVVL